LSFANELNKKKQFTDTKNFTVQCGICYEPLKGNEDIVVHSKRTGHSNYVQLKK